MITIKIPMTENYLLDGVPGTFVSCMLYKCGKATAAEKLADIKAEGYSAIGGQELFAEHPIRSENAYEFVNASYNWGEAYIEG